MLSIKLWACEHDISAEVLVASAFKQEVSVLCTVKVASINNDRKAC